ncbi:hypothetical protein EYD10_18420 [Varanus komodoensis]|nr:hypothetical protein EYD10_18420 [Varanus komodoensis]
MFLLLLLLCWLVPQATQRMWQTQCIVRGTYRLEQDYFSPGELIVGGNLRLGYLYFNRMHDFASLSPLPFSGTPTISVKTYQDILALAFAIQQLRKHPVLLPNITLGFRIYEHRDIARTMNLNNFALLSTRGRLAPNYKCDRQDPLLSVIGGFDSESSGQVASIFSIYKVPQGPSSVGKDSDASMALCISGCTEGMCRDSNASSWL